MDNDKTTDGYRLQYPRFCLECGDELQYGKQRVDRKFCSQKCRYTYYYNQNRGSRIGRMKTIGALDRNYAVLCGLLEQGICEIRLIEACELGFNPSVMTSMVKIKNHTECGLYDIQYRLTGSKISDIRKSSLYLQGKTREY